MITKSLGFASISVFALAPAHAQDFATPTQELAEAAEEAAAAAAMEKVSPAPAPLPPGDYSASAAPTTYEALAPNPADYPPQAWVVGDEGDVGYRLYVGADGKPQSCEITESSGSQLLDEATCPLLMERLEFDPALDREGVPVASEFDGRYTWSKREPEFGGPMTIHVAYTVGTDGIVSDCEVIEISGTISEQMRRSFDREPCPGSRNSTGGAPFRDENGVPVERRVSLMVRVGVEETAE